MARYEPEQLSDEDAERVPARPWHLPPDLIDEIHFAVRFMGQREMLIFLKRCSGWFWHDIAKEHGITKERARQLGARATYKLELVLEAHDSMPRASWL